MEANDIFSSKASGKEGYISLKQLAKEIYPIDYYDEDYAYKKILKNFGELCTMLGIDKSEFKAKRNYDIPLSKKTNWSLMLNHFKMFDNKSTEETKEFLTKLYSKKAEINRLMFGENVEELNVEDLASIQGMFYNTKDVTYIMEQQLLEEINRNFNSIRSTSPEDRIVLYCEFYHEAVMKKVKQMNEFVKKMSDEEWSKKTGNEK
ncbi:hypothetical protein K9O30_01720 [Clostridium bowmanii]|uniref:hypothetical protein n=1 Tax=Clostridium bowmanii TaxID=132925 RepID=UPI001C0D88FC|nr:hypothetical protein [Clostridium bowmanii]MBU3190312.1 hypothetical protein [Clostridium bowmanii]MCA1072476.1 hypothetical protein [Clostridium bowmanii]